MRSPKAKPRVTTIFASVCFPASLLIPPPLRLRMYSPTVPVCPDNTLPITLVFGHVHFLLIMQQMCGTVKSPLPAASQDLWVVPKFLLVSEVLEI